MKRKEFNMLNASVFVNGKKVGKCTGVSYGEKFDHIKPTKFLNLRKKITFNTKKMNGPL